MSDANSRLVGTWRLRSAEFRAPDGQVSYLYGERPDGMLVYTAAGEMIGQVMQPERPPLPRSASAPGALADYQAILRGYVAYYGRYSVDWQAGTITHHVAGSLIPGWVGNDQVRLFELAGNTLTLRTPAGQLRGATLAGALVWQRAG